MPNDDARFDDSGAARRKRAASDGRAGNTGRAGNRGSEDAVREIAGIALLGFLPPAVAAPPGARERLLARIAREGQAAARPARRAEEGAAADSAQVWKRWTSSPSAGGFTVVRGDEGGFEQTSFPGVSVRRLAVDPESDFVTMLVRMEPGTRYPAHRHGGAEECLVLDGDLRVGDATMRAGDYQRAEKGSAHVVQSTERGCLLFIRSSQHDEILAR